MRDNRVHRMLNGCGSLRIHLPPAEVLEQGRAKRPQSAPRMNFGRALNTVRAKAAR